MIKFKIGLLVSSLALLSACSDNSNTVQQDSAFPSTQVGVSIARNDATSPFLQQAFQSFKKVGEEQSDTKVVIESADGSFEKQTAQLEQMLSQGAKALVIHLADASKGTELINKYCGKVPLVFYNLSPDTKALSQCKDAYFVDSDVSLSGQQQGLSVLENWGKHPEWDKNKDGNIQLAVLAAIPTEASSIARTKWALSTIESYPALSKNYQIVFQDFALYQTDLAKETVNKWMSSPQFQNVEVLISSSDSMALGAVEALKAQNVKLPIFSINGLSIAQQAIKDGYIISSVPFDSDSEAKVAVRLAANLAAGQDPLAGISQHMFDKVIRVPHKNETVSQ